MMSLYRRRPLNLCIFMNKPPRFGSRVRYSYLFSIFEFITTVSVMYITHVKLYIYIYITTYIYSIIFN